jgi:hypothetical protein
MKTKIFKGNSTIVENSVNNFLATIKKENIFQIQYCATDSGNAITHCCMVIYFD